MKETDHIVNKVFLEINTKDKKKAYDIKDNINVFLKKNLFPRLEKLLEEYNQPDKIFRIDKLNLNFAVNNWENINEINFQFEKSLTRELSNNIQKSSFQFEQNKKQAETNSQKLSPFESQKEVLFFFLKNGYLPWFGKKETIRRIIKKQNWNNLIQNQQFFTDFKKILFESETAIKRFIAQFPAENILIFLSKSSHYFSQNKTFVKEFAIKSESKLRNIFLELLVKVSISPEEKFWLTQLNHFINILRKQFLSFENIEGFSLPKIQEIIIHFFPFSYETERQLIKELFEDLEFKIQSKEKIKTNRFPDKIDHESNKTDKKTNDKIIEHEPETEFFEKPLKEVAVSNAGIILIHPFLKNFFEKLNWLDTKNRILKNKQKVAVQTLHYLASGEEDFFEGTLLLEKYLCGVPLNFPIQIESLLDEKIKQESELLLRALIKNWPALKNTSVTGLQSMFFHRDGKLIKNEKNFRLIVERKAQDVLLDKLPWNISIVKIPWLNNLLFVEW